MVSGGEAVTLPLIPCLLLVVAVVAVFLRYGCVRRKTPPMVMCDLLDRPHPLNRCCEWKGGAK